MLQKRVLCRKRNGNAQSLRTSKGAALLLAWLVAACSPQSLPSGEPFKLSELVWNGKQQDFGAISTVTELYDDTLIFTSLGTVVLTGGVTLAMDPSLRNASQAAVLPAADLSGSWAVAIADDGSVRRLKNRSVMEDVSDRYGLAGIRVSELSAMGTTGAVFRLPDEIAVADGQHVTRFSGALRMLAGSDGRVAGVLDGRLRLLDVKTAQARDFDLGAPTGVLFDGQGKLFMSTADALYEEDEPGSLRKVLSSPDEPIQQMVRAGSTLFLQLGTSLAMLRDGALRRAADADALAALPEGTRIIGSPSGDLWTLLDGKLRLLGEDSGGGADEDLWRRNAQPIFTRLCATCHLPGGSAGIDLSTYAKWAARRDRIAMRVLDGKPTPMPPAGAGTLTSDEQAALQAWTVNMPTQ